MRVYAITDVGKVRPINEDSFYLPKEGELFCAVADGMGGHNAGEVASALAVKAFAASMRASEKLGSTAIHHAVTRANEEVHEEARFDSEKIGMGTTFTALCQEGDNVHIAHVGDSRAYLLRNGALMQVTTDHTLVEEMVMQGLITPKEARVHPKRNYITRALGTKSHVEIDLVQIELRAGDVFLMCTDGLSNHVDERKMQEVSKSEGDWNEKLKVLVNCALENGGSDNITAMYVTFEEGHE